MKAMIFAAGLGTRLKPFTDHHPKALAEVSGKTLLEHTIRYLQKFGIEDVIVNVHHFADQIDEAINENSGYGSWVTVSDERESVLETGGGLQKAAWYFEGEEDFVVINVDVLTNLDLSRMIEAHQESDALATLAVMKRNSTRQLLFDEHMILCGWTNNTTGEQKISREVLSLNPFAFSGVQAVFDEAIAGTMLRWIVALCQDEMTRKGGVMDSDTSLIGELPPSHSDGAGVNEVNLHND